ncbi:MAG: hypothetical protein PHE17_15290 [Thiothrix sp.]|jgi:hypothetical protein|nr:hypothetical protein [Thiothrix sp.]MDD5394378.1 hypothetical protein [Thiothrix sp.]
MNLKKNRWSLPAFGLLLSAILVMTLSAIDHNKAAVVAGNNPPPCSVNC